MDKNLLTPEQQRIVALSTGRHAVLSSPGTGKTELLAHRVVHALERGVRPDRMLCLTFTVRAAEEMRRRIAEKLPNRELPEIGNIHQVCRKLLFETGVVPPHWRVVDELTQLDLLRDVVEELDVDVVASQCRTGVFLYPKTACASFTLPRSRCRRLCVAVFFDHLMGEREQKENNRQSDLYHCQKRRNTLSYGYDYL